MAVTRNTQTFEKTLRYVVIVENHTLDGASTISLFVSHIYACVSSKVTCMVGAITVVII